MIPLVLTSKNHEFKSNQFPKVNSGMEVPAKDYSVILSGKFEKEGINLPTERNLRDHKEKIFEVLYLTNSSEFNSKLARCNFCDFLNR